jgi:hypothetical protein
MRFSDKDEFLEAVKKISEIKYDFDINIIYSRSWLLNSYLKQKRLD